jgi:hypothetical protein
LQNSLQDTPNASAIATNISSDKAVSFVDKAKACAIQYNLTYIVFAAANVLQNMDLVY